MSIVSTKILKLKKLTSSPRACYALRTRLAMPKKSKKEKILADLRRKVRTEQSSVSPTFQFQMKKGQVAPVQTRNPQQSSELTAIKRDLSKTFILAALAIAAELIIFFVRR